MTSYIGEIRMFAGNFAPAGWEFCQGQVLPIAEYDVLFNLIGTTYGGDGQDTFALPDLRGRVPLHGGAGPGLSQRILAEQGGVEQVTLTAGQIPAHTHAVQVSRDPASSSRDASNGVPAVVAATNVYGPVGTPGPMTPNSISSAGGGQAHDNMAPYLSLNFIMSMYGIYPSPT